jgi:hypothetical protein
MPRSRTLLIAFATAAALAVPVAISAAASHVKLFDNCGVGGAHYKPHGFVFACADHGLYIKHVRWSSWGSRSARGRGTGYANDCNPDCADGHYHHAAMTISLSSPGTCAGHAGVRVFRHVRYRWVHGDPAGPGPRTGSFPACPG